MLTPEQRAYQREFKRRRRLDPEYALRERERCAAWRNDPRNKERIREIQRKADVKRRGRYREGARRASKKYTETHGATMRDRSYLARFGITYSDKLTMIARQGNRCLVCGREFKNTRDQHVDHSHETGFVRGILCSNCNMGLGLFRDKPELMRAAALYLERAAKLRSVA